MTNPFVAPDLAAPPLSHIVDSPIGRLLLTGDGHALTGLYMINAAKHTGRYETGFTPRSVRAALSAASASAACALVTNPSFFPSPHCWWHAVQLCDGTPRICRVVGM